MTKKSKKKISEIYEFLKQFTAQNNYSPSYREIASAVNLKSINSVKEYLDVLEQQNLIKKATSKSRTIEVLQTKNQSILSVPLVANNSSITSSPLAEQNFECYIPISTSLFDIKPTDSIFAIKVLNGNIKNMEIKNGDIAIFRHQNFADDGDIVIALDDDSTNIKITKYSPNISIIGKVIGAFKRL